MDGFIVPRAMLADSLGSAALGDRLGGGLP